ncbi:SOS response-associated peptidase family protein [Paracidovorax sp. MALMAid1276]|uniref:SOS response-associated peptidase family protein n=1 Tax=Paracidovorax sp. MALMAid1276 TaxID=3411631 RepID=UPI003B9B68AA
MPTHYETLRAADTYREAFAVEPPAALGERHLRPRKPGAFIVHTAAGADTGHPDGVPASEGLVAHRPTRALVPAQWGLVPHWVKSASDAQLRAPKLTHAKADLAASGTAFRDAWHSGQRCIVPMQAFFEDDWRSAKKAVPTRIARVDGKPLGVAGLWARWQGADGTVIVSYCLLTVDASKHALLHRYGPPGGEKHMPVILNEGAYDAWLSARPDKAKEFMRQYAAQKLTANPVENKADKLPKGWLE